MQRFTKNKFLEKVEKNPTLVNFHVRNLEYYIPLPRPQENGRLGSMYDLIGNGKPSEGSYRVFVQLKSDNLWYELRCKIFVLSKPCLKTLPFPRLMCRYISNSSSKIREI
ncbi:hypothetical protein M0R45_018873 [Rubus argutus]|uniref:Uncharacterized protein n=1 Tax=Rubus argutus TaxID=59490 RepID=A0AAW1X647_RUBAR